VDTLYSRHSFVLFSLILSQFLIRKWPSESKLISYSESALKTEWIHICFKYFWEQSFWGWTIDPLTSPSGIPTNDVRQKHNFFCEIKCLRFRNNRTSKMEIDWTTKSPVWEKSVSADTWRGFGDPLFIEKWLFSKIFETYMNRLSFQCWFWIWY
jgi:hypothetical protein